MLHLYCSFYYYLRCILYGIVPMILVLINVKECIFFKLFPNFLALGLPESDTNKSHEGNLISVQPHPSNK